MITVLTKRYYICTKLVHKNTKAMLIVSSREFRDKQKSYLDQVDAGAEILIRRGKNRSYKIVPVEEDDTLMSKEEFFAKIDRSLQQAKEGKVTTLNSREELLAYLDSL